MPSPDSDDFDFGEEDCAFALYQAKWPNGFRCPGCDHRKAYRINTRRLPLYECAKCCKQTSLIAGTVMEGSRTPLTSWFRAIRLHASPDSVNALQLSKIISVTYKTAWLICHKIRHAMSRAEAGVLLSGLVKLTHTTYCPQFSAKHFFKWHPREQALLIGVSEAPSGQFDKIKLEVQNKHAIESKRVLPDTTRFLDRHIASGATVVQMTIQLRNRDTRVTRIGIQAKRRIAELFRGVGPKHLQAYLDQFCYDWNWRGASKLSNLLVHCARTKTLIYRNLIARTAFNPEMPTVSKSKAA